MSNNDHGDRIQPHEKHSYVAKKLVDHDGGHTGIDQHQLLLHISRQAIRALIREDTSW